MQLISSCFSFRWLFLFCKYSCSAQRWSVRSTLSQQHPQSWSLPHKQVLPLWHCVPCGREDPGHAWPSPPGREAWHVLHHGHVWFVCARPYPAASLLLLLYSQKSLPLYPRAAAGSRHRTGHVIQVRRDRFLVIYLSQVDVAQSLGCLCFNPKKYVLYWTSSHWLSLEWSPLIILTACPLSLQLSHIANHHEVSPGELWSGPADCSLRAASGGHHQHGWHSPVRGSGGHLYRSGQWVWLGLWPAGHY